MNTGASVHPESSMGATTRLLVVARQKRTSGFGTHMA